MNQLDIFKNYSIETDSFSLDDDQYTYNNSNMLGGTTIDKPTGGFPPIYICAKSGNNNSNIEISDDKKVREFVTHPTSVSIKDILIKRREITPFI